MYSSVSGFFFFSWPKTYFIFSFTLVKDYQQEISMVIITLWKHFQTVSSISSKGKELSYLNYYKNKALALSEKLIITTTMIIWNTFLGAFTEKQRRTLSFWISRTRSRQMEILEKEGTINSLQLGVAQMYFCISNLGN